MEGSARAGEVLEVTAVPVAALSDAERAEIAGLCERAFETAFADLWQLVPASSRHLLAHLEGRLVGHACWMPRWLEPEGGRLLRTAYFDAVAIEPELQRRGLGTLLMERAVAEIAGFEIGCLSTKRERFYARLGWERWRGPIFVRIGDGLVPSDNDAPVMIRRTPLTPPLDLEAPLSVEWRAGSAW